MINKTELQTRATTKLKLSMEDFLDNLIRTKEQLQNKNMKNIRLNLM
jgi:hypothetical protein